MNIRDIDNMDDLKDFISRNNLHIVYKSSRDMYGFSGIHVEKGEDWGLKIPLNTIWIDRNLRGRELFRTLKHEVEELILMRSKGLKYFPAHKIATRDETR